jgi:phage gpG-like protein
MSGMQIRATVIGSAEVSAKFARAGATVHDQVYRAVQEMGFRLLTHVKADKLSGQVLNVRTGRLRRSINMRMSDGLDGIYAAVGTNVVYARPNEFGAVTSPHEIVAKNAKALAFIMGVSQGAGGVGPGQMMFRKSVHHPGSKIPERSFLRSALADMRGEILDRIQQALNQALEA